MTEEKVEKVKDVISEKVKEYKDHIENVLVISGICYTVFYFYNKFVKEEYEEEEEEYEEEDYSNIVNNIDFKIYNIYDRR